MRAWLLDSFRGVEHLRLDAAPDPQPGGNEIVIRVRFAALNPADAFLAQAMYPAKPKFPHVLGRDGAGDVMAVGHGVTELRTGDTVGILQSSAGVETWGTLAERVVVPANSAVRIPSAWTIEEMAGAPLVYLTAWQALTQWNDAGTGPGSVVLVTGASGGVGVASVQLAKTMGCTVVALSRSEEKRSAVTRLGADFTFDPNDPELRKRVAAAIAPKKIDLVIDMVAGPLFNQVLAMLGHAGRISVVGRSGGAVPDFNTAQLLFRRNRIGGVSVGDYSVQAAHEAWSEIVRRLGSAGMRPQVDKVFPFEEVRAAFARLAEGPLGKVLVRVA